MYLLNISNSTFTRSFDLRYFKFVSFKVCGIIFKVKWVLKTFEMVNDTPLIAIEPFSSKYLELNLSEILSFNNQNYQ